MGEMAILDENGDSKVTWDCNKKDEIDNAKKEYEKLKKDGHTFFYLDRDGNQKGEMKKWDDTAELVLAIPKTRKG